MEGYCPTPSYAHSLGQLAYSDAGHTKVWSLLVSQSISYKFPMVPNINLHDHPGSKLPVGSIDALLK